MYQEYWQNQRSSNISIGSGADLAHWAQIEGVQDKVVDWVNEASKEITISKKVDKRLKVIREKMHGKGTAVDEWLYLLDELVCGDTQPHAVDMVGLGSDAEALKLAKQRSFRGLMQLCELGGDAVGVFGLNADMGSVAAIGVGVALTSRLIEGYLDNANGSTSQNIVREVIAPLQSDRRLKLTVKSVMAESGIESSVVDDPNLLYGLELNPSRLRRVDSILRPLLTGTAMVSSHNLWGLLVGGIGSLAKPLGDFVLRYEKEEKVPASKLAGNAGEKGFLNFMRNRHLQMVMGVRMAAEAPAFFKLATVLLRDQLGAQFAGTFIGAVEGVRGLSGTVTQSREAVASMEKVLAVLKTLEYLKDPKSPILSNVNYAEHVRLESITLDQVPRELSDRVDNGVVVHRLLPYFGSFPASGISAAFASGDIIKIDANSGQGKTVFLEAIRQSYNHDGLVAIKRNGVLTDVHAFSRREVRQKIVSLSKDSLDAKGGRVIDFASELFAMVVRNYDSKLIHDPIIGEVAKLVAGMSEGDKEILFNSGYDIAKLNKNNSIIGKYSIQLKQVIKPFLEMKQSWVNQLIQKYIPEKEKVTSLSMYDNELSQGQKQRVINALLRGYFEYGEVDMLVLDEIMEGLDPTNAQKTIDDLYQIIEHASYKPVIMWLSHTRNELPEKTFGSRYKEFDLGSGLYKTEKLARLKYAIKYESKYLHGEEVQVLRASVANAKSFLSNSNLRGIDWEPEFDSLLLTNIRNYIGIAHWKDMIENLTSDLGFRPTDEELLSAMTDESRPDINLIDAKDTVFGSHHSLWMWLNLPLIRWFTTDQLGTIFQYAPGETVRAQSRILNQAEAFMDPLISSSDSIWKGWVDPAIRLTTLQSFFSLIGELDESFDWYLNLLQNTLERYRGSDSSLWYLLIDNYDLPMLLFGKHYYDDYQLAPGIERKISKDNIYELISRISAVSGKKDKDSISTNLASWSRIGVTAGFVEAAYENIVGNPFRN